MPDSPSGPAPRAAAVVLKDEPQVRVVRIGDGDAAEVHKTYRNRGLRWLQTFGRRSRAARECANLARVHAIGVPCTAPLGWSEARRAGFVAWSTLRTAFAPDCRPLKAVLAERGPATAARRRRLAAAIGRLLRELHRHGLLWGTPMPRNLLLQGGDGGRLLVCDVPALVDFGRDLVGTGAAALDLWPALCSPSRQREFGPRDRWLGLLAYADGDRALARRLWRRLHRTGAWRHRLHKNLVWALRTYILPRLAGTRPPAGAPR